MSKIITNDIERINFVMKQQVSKCYNKYGKYASFHEAMAVFQEEVEELWNECKKKTRDFEHIESEIIDCMTVLNKMYLDVVIDRNER